MSGAGALESLLRRDRFFILAALAAVTALAGFQVLRLAKSMAVMSAMVMPLQPWTAPHFAFMLSMWVVMMVGMMLPTVAPVLLLYAGVARQSRSHPRPLAPTAWFAAGYALAWTAFSLGATLAQWALESMALLTPMMSIASSRVGGLLLIGVGIYQCLPLKLACLSHCRSPLSFMQRHGGFQTSAGGAIRLGLTHGFYCIGCCWALMCLLFVGGIMNLLWIAALVIFVLTEKLLPAGRLLPLLSGVAAIAAGVAALSAGR